MNVYSMAELSNKNFTISFDSGWGQDFFGLDIFKSI